MPRVTFRIGETDSPAHGRNFISIFLDIGLDRRKVSPYSDNVKTEFAAARFEALGSRTRLEVYRLLVRSGDEGMTVGRIQEVLGIPASTLSHHCRILVSVGLVTQERVGTMLVCRPSLDAMQVMVNFLREECCADSPQDVFPEGGSRRSLPRGNSSGGRKSPGSNSRKKAM
jgi:DNA-binding transcriptional ArsR family regulator